MADEQIKVDDEVVLDAEEATEEPEVEEPEVEEPEVEEPEVEEPEEEEPEEEKKPKPERGRGRQGKGKGADKGKGLNKGDAWWDMHGKDFERKGHSQRNVILKAAKAANAPFDRAMDAMRAKGSLEEKVKSLF